MAKLGDFDRWFKRCKCGYDTVKVSEKSPSTCWKCGSRLERDYSDRALKVNRPVWAKG
jgi:rRNA maturation endonuclease Nob1